jgi:hypothetical protein
MGGAPAAGEEGSEAEEDQEERGGNDTLSFPPYGLLQQKKT